MIGYPMFVQLITCTLVQVPRIAFIPIRFARNKGVPPVALRIIEKLVYEQSSFLMERYHEYPLIKNPLNPPP